MMHEIMEERLFAVDGAWLATTTTPMITRLRPYREALGSRIAQIQHTHLQGHQAVVFRLYDGRTLMAILRAEVGVVVCATTPTVMPVIAEAAD
jgi:hypothetical protein